MRTRRFSKAAEPSLECAVKKLSLQTSPSRREVPYFRPNIGEEEINAACETLRSGWLTAGPRVKEFEDNFGAFVKAPYTIAVASCTTALQLAFEAMGVGPGVDVLVPTMTFASAVAVIIHLGARPVFVDCDPATLNMDVADLERRITPKSKVVVPMHFAGQPCALHEIRVIAENHGLRVIEDAAHALAATYHTEPIGSISEVSCFSFYANKGMTTGEGGMIAATNEDLARRMRFMAYNGINRDCLTDAGVKRWWKYEVVSPGYKANMTDIQAAIGIQQLKKAQRFRDERQRCADLYRALFDAVPSVRAPVVLPGLTHAWHMHVIQLELDRLRIGRDEFSLRLEEMGAGHNVHYLPLHMHAYYRDAFGYRAEDFPAAMAAYERILSLPIYPGLAAADIEYVVECIAAVAEQYKR
jgi:dTDP-4-amino-4,6-dideoxygalactose transaminase